MIENKKVADKFLSDKKADGKFLLDKKAQNLSITTIILIILGVIVLVVLILGFTQGWSNLKEWVAPSSNIEKIVSQCRVACSAENTYDYCSLDRTMKWKDTSGVKQTVDANCKELERIEIVNQGAAGQGGIQLPNAGISCEALPCT